MLDFSKILLPVDLEEPSLPTIHQAAQLARHFHSEIVMMHAVEPLGHLTLHDERHKALHAEHVLRAEAKLDAALHHELDGFTVKRLVLQGDPAEAILQAARDENVSLIVMGTHGFAGMAYFLVGSVTAQIVTTVNCPIWTGPHPANSSAPLEIQNVLCALALSPDERLISSAAEIAREFGAKLTLAHVVPDMDTYSPGGIYADVHGFARQLVAASESKIAKLKQAAGVEADVFVASGDVATVLASAAQKTGADLMVIGRHPRGGWLGGHAYPIISRSPISVLSL
jgi:nucleotide-binding universal stress UspA family protein